MTTAFLTRIVNCSWGFDSHSSAIESTFKSLSTANMVAVVAAGNYLVNIDDPSVPAIPGLYPARYTFSNMIVVGATSITDKAWQHPGIPQGTQGSGSNFGAVSVDLFAPGDGVRAMLNADSLVSCTAVTAYGEVGTSFAAPLVSGVAAMVWTLTPSLTAEEVVQVLKGTVRYNPDLAGLCETSGIVNAAGAVGLGPCTPQSIPHDGAKQ